MMKRLNNQSGFSIVEALLGLAMIGLVGSFFIEGFLSMKKLSVQSGTKNALYKQINDVIENVRPNIRMYQINYSSKENEKDEALALNKLQMAWGNGFISKAKKCSNCPGRFGYIIQSYPGMKGLYLVTIRMSHKDWAQDKNVTDPSQYGYFDYQFVVNAQ